MVRKRKPAASDQPEPEAKPKVCKVDGCTAAKTYTLGLCALHWTTRGDLADPVPPPAAPGSVLKTGPTEPTW